MLAPTFLYPGPGAADPAKECALLGLSIPGSAWEAKGLSWQQKPNTRQRGGTRQLAHPQIWAHILSLYLLVTLGLP